MTFRPARLHELVLPDRLRKRLEVIIASTKIRTPAQPSYPVDHILLYGPPGTGKTTIARILAEELHRRWIPLSATSLHRPAELISICLNLQKGDILFIDEIHRLAPRIQEHLAQIMEDFQIGEVVGIGKSSRKHSGIHARAITFHFAPFTVIGATTRLGLIPGFLRSRFGILLSTSLYTEEDLCQVIERYAKHLKVSLNAESARLVARASRATPRLALHLVRRLLDYLLARYRQIPSVVEVAHVWETLEHLGICPHTGLHPEDQQYLRILLEKFQGGPAGVRNLAHALHMDVRAVEEHIEPFLIYAGYIQRTLRGRIALPRAYQWFQHYAEVHRS